ncbi:hypothetical protein ONS95_007971 [Cadophora gregata]|uniref:uncharacterized protein n=1 Tax=Cadophora gregata TaxID=51156 RepID=UPI0026DADD16|nr:uncharacterized protein ONS95_007971 [Cadophora gregata]KAK0119107.1 hypothetical protein ONS96_012173 [Cadophora gregata f. sp. sojae]KAK0126365.1 hypothetical protein ONS95_007971 [Cadophora gregata]
MDIASSPVAFILDFDGTITQKDTISTIANFAIAFHKARGEDFQDSWDINADTYAESYARCLHGYKTAREDRKTLAEEIAYLRATKGIEVGSFTAVSKSGIFQGIGEEQWRQGGRDAIKTGDVNVRKGFRDFIQLLCESGAIWGVVSVNFSSQFIRGVLEASLEAGAAELEVLANDPDEEGTLRGPSRGPVMATSDAKLAAMNELLQRWKSRSKAGVPRVVYIGDSGTDIECLTAEGVIGIVISRRAEPTPGDWMATVMMDMLKRVGLEPVHVGSQQEGKGSSLYWARDFGEIIRSPLLGLETVKD